MHRSDLVKKPTSLKLLAQSPHISRPHFEQIQHRENRAVEQMSVKNQLSWANKWSEQLPQVTRISISL